MEIRKKGHTRKRSRSLLTRATTHIDVLEPRQLFATTIYVDLASPGPTHDGTAWTSAYTDLQTALTAAQAGDTVKVADGIYKPTTGTSRAISFKLKSGVQLLGGFAGYGAPDPEVRSPTATPSILSGDIGTQGSATDNSFHVVTASAVATTAVLDGFTIRDGNASSSGTNASGGGLYVSVGGAPSIANCTFTANAANSTSGSGGGVYSSNSVPSFSHCTFSSNSANYGGGLAIDGSGAAAVLDCTFSSNSATNSGGAIALTNSATPSIANSTLSSNSAASGGGGLYASFSSPTVSHTTFASNSANGSSGNGGGALVSGAVFSVTPTFDACLFSANTARTGGGIYDSFSASSVLTSCLFTGHTAINGAVATSSSGTKLRNCTIVASAPAGSGWAVYNSGSTASLTSCVLWTTGTAYPPISTLGGSTTVTYSDVRGGFIGTGNINTDPLFTAYPSDLSLQLTSPCIDKGSNANLSTTASDVAGNPRLTDVLTTPNSAAGWADMGAYERTYAPTTLWFAQTSVRAFESDGAVSVPIQLSSYTSVPVTIPISVTGGTADPSDYSLPASITVPAGQSLASLPIVTVTDDRLVEPAETLQITLGTPNNAVLGSPVTFTLTIVDNDLIYVDPRATAGTHEGNDWADAFTDLQAALAKAGTGSTIRVAAGSYEPTSTTDRTISFVMKSGIALYGGYAGLSLPANPDTRNTVLYPSLLGGGYHVLVASNTDRTAVLDGFTVTGGNANSSEAGQEWNQNGGGIYIAAGSPTIANCIFTSDTARFAGNAIFDSAGSAPYISNCVFTANTSDSAFYGGAIYNDASSPTITGCSFSANSAFYGGAVYNSGGSAPFIANCTFTAHTAGAILNTGSSPIIVNCVFVANSSSNGGAINNAGGSPQIINCTFADNSAATSGGAIYNVSSSPLIINSILWGNTAIFGSQLYSTAGAATVSYSDVQGGYTGSGTADIAADPLFVRAPSPGPDGVWRTADDDYGDLRLSPASPAVDAASNAAIPPSVTTDILGGPRFLDVPTLPDTGVGPAPVADLGAYEAVSALAANAGGPYVTFAGQSLTLHGLGSSDAPGALRFDWEWTGNGLFDDATGSSVAFPVASYPPGTSLALTLRVTDAQGRSVTSAPTTLRVAPTTVYVDPRATGAANGTSWSDAFTSLAAALALAVPGQTLHVATGTYTPTASTDRTATFALQSGVTLYGGYAGLSAPANPDARDPALYPTTLSGDIGTPANAADNSYHVVTSAGVDSTAVLDGFTITGGNASTQTALTMPYGGGLFNYAGSPTIANDRFVANSARNGGGGIYNYYGAPTITNCTFAANTATVGSAGGMYNDQSAPVITGCTFTANSTVAIYNTFAAPTVVACTFTANAGTAVNNFNSPTATVTSSLFVGNAGSAIYTNNNSSTYDPATPSIADCVFIGNHSLDAGGGVYNFTPATILNCTFYANSAVNYAGAVYGYSGTMLLTNSILSGDTAGINGPEVYGYLGYVDTAHSDVQGGWGNAVNFDPGFVRLPSPGPDSKWGTADDDLGDLSLSPGSPAIDTGSNSAVPPSLATDFAGNARIRGPVVDLGAYEAPYVPPTPPAATFSAPTSASEGSSTATLSLTSPTGSGPYAYSFDFNNDGTFEISNSTSASATIPASLLDGPATLTVRARITGPGGFADYTAPVTVTNLAPSAAIAGAPAAIQVNRPLTLTATATDPSPTDVAAGFTYAWTATLNGSVIATKTSSTFTLTPGATGSLSISLTVSDKDGGTSSPATATVSITAQPQPPTATLNAPTTLPEGSPAALLSLDNASGAGPFTYAFDLNNDGTFEIANTSTASTTIPAGLFADGPVTRTVRARITDSIGLFTDYSATISVTDAAPTAAISTPPASAPANHPLTLTASATDPSSADSAAGYIWHWTATLNGSPIATSTASTFTFTPATAGTLSISLTATDKDGVTSTAATASVAVTNSAPPPDTTPPAAQPITSLPAPAPGSDTYTFTVSYTDDIAVGVASLGNTDVLVTGPGGFSAAATFVSSNVTGYTTVATYSFTAPNNAWDSRANGTYTLALQPNAVTDTAGNPAPGATLGTLAVNIPAPGAPDTTIPTAAITSPLSAPATGAADYTFTVTYNDNDALDLSSFDTNDLLVTGPGNFSANPALVSYTLNDNTAVATYSLSAPGGSWDFADNGNYVITLQSNQVADNANNPALPGQLATLSVDLPSPDAPILASDQGNHSPTAPDLQVNAIALKKLKLVNGALLGGSSVSGTVSLKNTGRANMTGTATVTLYLSTDGTASTADTVLKTFTVPLATLKPAKATKSVPFTITLPSNVTGHRSIIAVVTPNPTESTTLDNAKSLAPINLAPPITNLTAVSLKAKAGKKPSATFTVKNTGNQVFNHVTPIALYFTDSATGQVTSLGTIPTALKLNPAQLKSLNLKLTLPTALAGHRGMLTATVDPNNAMGQSTNADDEASTTI